MTIRRTIAKRRPRQRRDKGSGVSLPGRSGAVEKPHEWTENDVEGLRELHAQRSYVAQKTDEHLIAPIAPSPSHWIKYPGEYDVYGVDYPEWKARKQMEKRSETAQATDLAKKAPLAPTPEEWAKHPDKYDLPGVDTRQKKQAKKARVDEQNPMGTPDAAKKYLADVVQTYRKKLGVKGDVKLHARNKGYPARIRHFSDGGTPQIEVNYRHFGIVWEGDPRLTEKYLEYMVAHEMAHQKQIEEIGYKGAKKAHHAARAEVEADADAKAFQAMGVSEKELEKTMDKLAKRVGGTHTRGHPPFKGEPDLSRFKDHTPPEKPQKAEEPAPKKRTAEEIRDQMKATYGKVLGKAIPSATEHEKTLIAEKAVAEEWVKASDTAKTAEARVTEKAKAELVKIRQEKAQKDREEQLKRLKERAEKARAKSPTEEARRRYDETLKDMVPRKATQPKPMEPQDDLPNLKKATAFSPEYNEMGMYEVEVYDPATRQKSSRQFSTADKAEKYQKHVNDNPGWPTENFKENIGADREPKYVIIAENGVSRGSEALKYHVYERLPPKAKRYDIYHDGRPYKYISMGSIEYKEVPGKQKIVEDLTREIKGTARVEYTLNPHWSPALSMVERIAPASPTGDRGGKWMVWFKNRESRDADPREGIGSKTFNTYEEALGFVRDTRGRYDQQGVSREATWLTVPDPPTLPSELESFTGKSDSFEVDPRSQYEGVWDKDRKRMDYRWVFKNKAGGNTHTLDQLKEEHQKGEWRRRDRAEAAKSSKTLTKEKVKRKEWDRKAQPLASAVIFNDAARIEAEGDTVTMMGMDQSHVALIKLRLPNDLGIPEGKYEVEYSHLDNRVTHLNHPEKVRWDNVERSLKVSKKDQESYINYEKVTDYKQSLPEPKVPFRVKAKVDLEALEKAASQKGIEHLALKVTEGRSALDSSFTYEATKWETRKFPPDEEHAYEREDRVEVQVSGAIGEVDRRSTSEDEAKAVYTASYLSANLGALIKAGFKDATLEYATDMPLKIAATRDDGAEAEFWLAPCIGV